MQATEKTAKPVKSSAVSSVAYTCVFLLIFIRLFLNCNNKSISIVPGNSIRITLRNIYLNTVTVFVISLYVVYFIILWITGYGESFICICVFFHHLKILFKCEIIFRDIVCMRNSYIPEMFCMITDTGLVRFAFRISLDKSILRTVFLYPWIFF